MFNWVIGLTKGLLPSILPTIILGISSLTAYYFYKTNESYKITLQRQEIIIADLRKVNEEVRGLYSRVNDRLNLIGFQSLQSISKLETIYFELDKESKDVLDTELPEEVLELLNRKANSTGRLNELD